MIQRIKLNIVEKIPPLKEKAAQRLPMEEIQLMYKSQLTPLIYFYRSLKSHQPPFLGLVISDYGIIFKTIKYKTPSIQGFLSELFAQRIQDSV